MSLKEFSIDAIREKLQKASTAKDIESIRLLFTPREITQGNLRQVCEIYGAILNDSFDTVVLLNDSTQELEKPICMSDHKFYETPFGRIPVNDALRNEFADEEDDFFILNEGFDERVGLNDQLMMLQAALDEFNVVNIEISNNERPSIIRELAFVLQEVLEQRNALIVVSVDLEAAAIDIFKKLNSLMTNWDRSHFLNTLWQETTNIHGKSGFMAGVLVAKSWHCWTDFIRPFENNEDESLLAGYSFRKLG